MAVIEFLRLGYANNSSSSHSIIYTSKYNTISEEENDGEYYGWECFTLTTKSAKKEYLFTQLYDNIDMYLRYNGKLNSIKNRAFGFNIDNKVKIYNYILNNFSSVFSKEELDHYVSNIKHVDHQSILSFPRDINSGGFNIEFLKDFFNYFINTDEVIILGGNDSGGEHPLTDLNEKNNIFEILKALFFVRESIFIKDEVSNSWIIQNKKRGDLVRISFDKPTLSLNKLGFPSLVDLKITDYCNFGCKFCYQNSTKRGKHGDVENIKKIIDVLAESNTQEIAIGGGEPTLHPDLFEILLHAKSKNFVIGITTKNYKLYDIQNIKLYFNFIDSLAISCNSMEDLESAKNLRKQLQEKGIYTNIYVQSILELIDPNIYENFIKEVYKNFSNFTLLGYKNYGRGNNNINVFKPNDNWLDVIYNSIKNKTSDAEYYGYNFGVDTVIVNRYNELLKSNNKIKKYLYNNREGNQSCYVDAVELKMGMCSFTNEYDNITIHDFNKEVFLNNYKGY